MAQQDNAFDKLNDDILRASKVASYSGPDEQELKEREEAAQAYAGESEKHFVEYYMDCKKTSVDSKIDIRKDQAELYKMYKEDEPEFYGQKETWQSRTILPGPFGTVEFGTASVKKAFKPDFLTIEDKLNKEAADFWQAMMLVELGEMNAKFVTRFGDATKMSLAIGDSMEMIPQYIPGIGLRFDLIEPWKIHRDPDALARDPQSGLFWTHEEWLDFFVLLRGEKSGKYFNVARAKNTQEGDSSIDDDLMSKDAIAERKKQIYTRSNFRNLILTGEFWGTILSPKGEVLIENGTYTVAGYRVIEKPRKSPYEKLRWPGVSFSAIPDLLAFEGRGLLKSVQSLWNSMNQIMCLHEDNYRWIVNPVSEIMVDNLIDPSDPNLFPGKECLVKETLHGENVVRTVDRRDISNSVLANLAFMAQNFQKGTFVNDAIQGLPGYREDMTYRESAQNLSQALGVFSEMGANIEDGARWAVEAARDVVKTFAGYKDYLRCLGEDVIKNNNINPKAGSNSTVEGIPELSGKFNISGMTALLKEQETLAHLREVIIPLANTPRFAPYMKPFYILKALEQRINLTDEKVFATDDEAKEIDAAETERMKKGEHIQAVFQSLEAKQKQSDVEKTQVEIQEKLAKIETMIAGIDIKRDQTGIEIVKTRAEINNKR